MLEKKKKKKNGKRLNSENISSKNIHVFVAFSEERSFVCCHPDSVGMHFAPNISDLFNSSPRPDFSRAGAGGQVGVVSIAWCGGGGCRIGMPKDWS